MGFGAADHGRPQTIRASVRWYAWERNFLRRSAMMALACSFQLRGVPRHDRSLTLRRPGSYNSAASQTINKDPTSVEAVHGGRMQYSVKGNRLHGVYHALLKKGLTVRSAVLLILSFSATAGVHVAAQDKGFVLERDGRTIVLEPYAPNILRITMSRSSADATASAGYGLTGTPAISGWRHEKGAGNGDEFRSGRLIVHVSADQLPQSLLPQRMPLDDLNQSLREHYFGGGSRSGPNYDVISVTTASGKALLSMRSWSMVANRPDRTPSQAGVAGQIDLGYRVSATFESPEDEHYYGLGQIGRAHV